MVKKGKMLYVPPVVIDEVEDIIREDKVNSRADAFKELTKYCRVGREVNRLRVLDFSKRNILPPVESYNRKKKGRK